MTKEKETEKEIGNEKMRLFSLTMGARAYIIEVDCTVPRTFFDKFL
jgi:hypothetical protein